MRTMDELRNVIVCKQLFYKDFFDTTSNLD